MALSRPQPPGVQALFSEVILLLSATIVNLLFTLGFCFSSLIVFPPLFCLQPCFWFGKSESLFFSWVSRDVRQRAEKSRGRKVLPPDAVKGVAFLKLQLHHGLAEMNAVNCR